MTKALIIIDVQNDFCPGGALAVNDGNAVVAPINALMDDFETIIFTQDWHPIDHSSFADNQAGRQPFDTIDMPYGEQTLWPVHCVQGTSGAAFHPDLKQHPAQMIIRKGFRPDVDSYSAFFENDHKTATGLDGYLRSRDIKEVVLAGLATDFCVAFSALDAARLGYTTRIITAACRAIDLAGSLNTQLDAMRDAGVILD